MSESIKSHRDREIAFLRDLKATLKKAKHELNNDLTKLAVINLPMMVSNDTVRASNGAASASGDYTIISLDSGQTSSQKSEPESQHLEPLDLDL